MLRPAVFSVLCLLLVFPAGCKSEAASQPNPEIVTPAPINSVVALGRLEPEGALIKVSVSHAQDSRVNQLFVNEGDRVQENQVIALLQGVERRTADLRNAEAEVRLREAERQKVLQGDSKIAQIQAQQSRIDELQAQIRAEQVQRQAAILSTQAVIKEAKLRVERLRTLNDKGVVSLSDLNQAERDLETAQATLMERQAALQQTVTTLEASIRQAEAELQALKEVRPLDVEIAEANLDKAKIEVEQRKADLEDVRVRAPATGQILRINTRVGEQVNTAKGIVELARTQQMYAIAEVYESDIVRVNAGQSAKITTDYGAFKGTLNGVVEDIGLQIGRRTVKAETENGPNQDQDARVVEVKVRINPSDSAKVAKFTNMLVQVSIDTATESKQGEAL